MTWSWLGSWSWLSFLVIGFFAPAKDRDHGWSHLSLSLSSAWVITDCKCHSMMACFPRDIYFLIFLFLRFGVYPLFSSSFLLVSPKSPFFLSSFLGGERGGGEKVIFFLALPTTQDVPVGGCVCVCICF